MKTRSQIGNLKYSDSDIVREVVFDQLAMMQLQFSELCNTLGKIGKDKLSAAEAAAEIKSLLE